MSISRRPSCELHSVFAVREMKEARERQRLLAQAALEKQEREFKIKDAVDIALAVDEALEKQKIVDMAMCSTCVYFHEPNNQCRRHPPVIDKGFPFVTEDCWCGEYRLDKPEE